MIILIHQVVQQKKHIFQQDENIQNAETENPVLLNEEQLETKEEALQQRKKKTRTPLRKFWQAEQTYQYRARKKKQQQVDLQNDMVNNMPQNEPSEIHGKETEVRQVTNRLPYCKTEFTSVQ